MVDAVRCATEVQHAMVERNAGVAPDKRIEFRIGIHLGDVVEEADGDLMGDGVNIAARLEGIAAPGAICLSEDAYRQVKGRLDLAVTDLGLTQLKNIAEPIRSLFVANRPPRAGEVCGTDGARAAEEAFRARGRACGASHCRRGRRVVVPRCKPSRQRRHEGARRRRASFDCRAALRQSVGRSGAGLSVDALTDELTTALARLRDSFVIARNTAMTFKGKPVDAKAIGKDLGVRYVLEGSVQPSGDQMRVNAQLIDAGSGAHLWAEQFDTPRADLLQMQDAIVTHLARAVDFQLTEAEAARLKRTPAVNPAPRTWLFSASRAFGRPDRSARRRMLHPRFANRRWPSIPTMSVP